MWVQWILKNGKDNLKEMLISLFESFPPEHNKLLGIILNQYLETILQYRIEAVKYLNNDNYAKDEKEFHFAYHKEMEGLTDEEIADALRFYKEMKKRIEKDNK